MSLVEKTKRILANADALNPELNSFLSIERDHALGRAKEIGLTGYSGKKKAELMKIFYAERDLREKANRVIAE